MAILGGYNNYVIEYWLVMKIERSCGAIFKFKLVIFSMIITLVYVVKNEYLFVSSLKDTFC